MTRSQHVRVELAYPEPPDATVFFALLEHLERNLLASQQVLVSGDLKRLEELTGEQVLFARKLANLLKQASSAAVPPVGPSAPEMQREVRAAQLRILQLGRVHMALLARREQGLRTLRHRLAGPQSLYSLPQKSPDFGAELRRARRGRQTANPCQA